jgi:hypothetical protein
MKHLKFIITLLIGVFIIACTETPVSEKGPATPPLVGTWLVTSGIYIRGAVYSTLAYNSGDSLVFKDDSTYVSYIHKMGSVNGQGFSGTGSGTWSADDENISFSYPLGGAFEYSFSGNSITMTNGELTIDAYKK